MLPDRDFVKQSLDINLFFLRIMKEHAYFIDAALLEKNADLKKQARMFNKAFGELLVKTAKLAHGVVGLKNDAVTEYTLEAERMSEFLTGAPIDRDITKLELKLAGPHGDHPCNPSLVKDVYELNCRVIEVTENIICFKAEALKAVLECKLYTSTYPLLLDHIRREAELFLDILVKLQRRDNINIIEDALKQEAFWNTIMAEHSEFIRGFLDPTERDLIGVADDFANEFYELRREALAAAERTGMINTVTDRSIEATRRIRDFNKQASEGMLECKIRSIALPLLADHVLRESNHFLILLRKYDTI
jgi:Domain of unknown function (DUF2935)